MELAVTESTAQQGTHFLELQIAGLQRPLAVTFGRKRDHVEVCQFRNRRLHRCDRASLTRVALDVVELAGEVDRWPDREFRNRAAPSNHCQPALRGAVQALLQLWLSTGLLNPPAIKPHSGRTDTNFTTFFAIQRGWILV